MPKPTSPTTAKALPDPPALSQVLTEQ